MLHEESLSHTYRDRAQRNSHNEQRHKEEWSQHLISSSELEHLYHFRWRPYRVECTGSLSNSEVKRHRARLVLGWGTAWEDLWVLSAFHNFLGICLLVWSCFRAAVDETVSEYGDGIMVNFFKDFFRVEGQVNGERLEERILREILKRDFCEKEKKREREKDCEQCIG